MEWKNISTNKQRKRLIQETVKALKDLLACPETKDLIKDIVILTIGNQSDSSTLCLTKDGLVEKIDHLAWAKNALDSDSHEKYPIKQDFNRTVEKYRLETESIKELKSKLLS